ncbi:MULTISPECIES: hypothetical protein [Burkholderia]|uniref:Uncharacterized protein n=1 Tax=Burkholderia diffusa TaxID=488732 RepID=A0A6P2KK13_9BURK|nr:MULTISPECIES: hypothetical protein [Burkholderia]VWB55969.1 hypothetical protein BDI24065_02595 [Burkholderia diffusa]
MMLIPKNETVVIDIASNRCVVLSDVPAHVSKLQTAGFHKQGDQWIRPISDDADRQHLVRMLMELNALFSAGRDWSAQELVEHYRENGAVTAPYRSVSWVKPDEYRIVEHG